MRNTVANKAAFYAPLLLKLIHTPQVQGQTNITNPCCGARRSQGILAGADLKVRLRLQLRRKKILTAILFVRSNIYCRQIKKLLKIVEFLLVRTKEGVVFKNIWKKLEPEPAKKNRSQ